MNLRHETSFTVYPVDANSMFPMIFGGAFFSYLDKAAAVAVKRLLHDSPSCQTAVTHKFEGTYLKPCYVGDLIFIEAEIISLGKKSVVVQTKAFREKAPSKCDSAKVATRELVADARYVFVTVEHDEDVGGRPESLPYHLHGLPALPDKSQWNTKSDW